jgi:hypothetical protein
MATKKATKKQNQKARIRKAKSWVATYQGPDIVLAYGKRFKVDPICAAKDLEAMKASTEEQRVLLKQAHDLRVQKEREERMASLARKLEKRNVDVDALAKNPAAMQKALKDSKPDVKKSNPKRRCINCGRAMKQQFIGLKHCKCGTSWSKSDGYFERTPDMVFALERRITKKSKNSVRTKQVPVIRYMPHD